MQIKLDTSKIALDVSSEESLEEEGVLDCLYVIRALRAAILLNGFIVEVSPANACGQIFLVEFDIWIDKEHYTVTDDL